jgi:hypothetical protein
MASPPVLFSPSSFLISLFIQYVVPFSLPDGTDLAKLRSGRSTVCHSQFEEIDSCLSFFWFALVPGLWAGPALSLPRLQPIFDRSCATSFCHAGANPQQGMSLEAGKSYDNIVDVPSGEAASVMRVKPFDAENSYLYRKLEGEQGDLGGSGNRMPSGKPALAEDQIKLIEDWINQGALKEPPPPTTAVEASAWGQVKRLVEEWVK